MNTLDDLYKPATQPKKPLIVTIGKILMGRLGVSIVGSIIVGTLMNLPYLKTFVRWTCHILLMVLGRPDMPEQHKLENLVAKAKEAVHSVHDPSKPSLKEKVTEKIKEAVASEAAAPVKHAASKARESVKVAQEKVTEKVTEVKETAKTEAKNVVDKLDNLRSSSNAPPGNALPGNPQLPGNLAIRQQIQQPKYGPSLRQRAKKSAGRARAQRDGAALNAEIAAGMHKAEAANAAAEAARAADMRAAVNGMMGGR